MLATDGNPTGHTNGSQYNPSEWQNTQDGAGVVDLRPGAARRLHQLTALRTTSVGGRNYDVQTYVVGMGDTLANPSSIAALNQMALLGGGYPTAFVGSSTESLQRAFQAIVGDIQAKTSAASSVALNTGSWTTGSALYQAKFNSSDWSGSLLNYAVAGPARSARPRPGTPARRSRRSTGAAAAPSSRTSLRPPAGAARHSVPLAGAAGDAERDRARPQPDRRPQPDAGRRQRQRSASCGCASCAATRAGSAQLHQPAVRRAAVQESRHLAARRHHQLVAVLRRRAELRLLRRLRVARATAPSSAPTVAGRRSSTWAATTACCTRSTRRRGAEMFAYVPSTVYADLSKLTDLAYTHRYFVDGSPTVGDVFYERRLAHPARRRDARRRQGPVRARRHRPVAFQRSQRRQHRALGVPGSRPRLRVRPAAAGEDQQRPLVGDRERRLQRRQRERSRLPVRHRCRDRNAGEQDRHRLGHGGEPDGLSAPGGDRQQRRRHRRHRLRGRPRRQLWKFDISARQRRAGRSATARCRSSPPAAATPSPAGRTSRSSPPGAFSSPSEPAATSPTPTTPT